MDSILELRPSGTTAADIAAALQRAEAAAAEARQTVADAKERRDGLLLDGSSAQLTSAERLLVAAKDMVERIAAMAEQLKLRLAVAEKAEHFARLAEARKAAEAASAKRAKWWDATEPALRSTIIEGMRLQAAATDARYEWADLQRAVAQRYPDEAAATEYPRVHEPTARDWFDAATDALRGTMTEAELRQI